MNRLYINIHLLLFIIIIIYLLTLRFLKNRGITCFTTNVHFLQHPTYLKYYQTIKLNPLILTFLQVFEMRGDTSFLITSFAYVVISHTLKLLFLFALLKVFEMRGDSTGAESQMQVRVRNTDTKLVCVWPIAKMKERLQKMRKLMYAVSNLLVLIIFIFFIVDIY